MLVNGQALAQKIYDEVTTAVTGQKTPPRLTIITSPLNQATKQYLALKKRQATRVGVAVSVEKFPSSVSTNELKAAVTKAATRANGIIVQLPLPKTVDVEAVLRAIPLTHDVDGMHYNGTTATFMSPVVAALLVICQAHGVSLTNQSVVVVGNGRLVGAPAALWAKNQGANVTVLTRASASDTTRVALAVADILILGAGQAGFVKPEMVKHGVIIFDAGTSEEAGEVRGDADSACAQKASLITPVPGGLGPLPLVCLLKNLVLGRGVC